MQNALILAGGKSSRMGTDKTLLEFCGAPSITHFLFERLSKHFDNVKVASKQDKFNPKLPLVIDEFSEFAPIYVIANLDKYYNDPVFIIAADTPFVEIDTIKKLSKQKGQITLASDGEFIHYLCGFYSPSVAQTARNMIEKNDFRLSNLVQLCGYDSMKFGNLKQFFNINTKADYEEANI
ncbi:MAG: molybdenum cofactor guanylyltransferase [Campylobacter sp.]|uniref:molybdenum cofactor guanylyltransferase n=1 Tax=Campylobacter sp. TaxID=205 RepID=UPI001B24F33C|nr:molybdenum cofactor guanylyltransferase [Campylobacter sp.]MBO7154689.1 molybdenum cofactor guanylyltransferase [Campylobacter sp.]